MAQRLDSLKSAFETQRLMSSPERRREQEAGCEKKRAGSPR